MAWTSPEIVRWIKFSPSGLLLATTSQEELYADRPSFHRLWDALSGRDLARLEDANILHAMAFAAERELLIIGEEGCRLWDTGSGEVRDVGNMSYALTTLPGGKAVAVAQNALRVFDPHTGQAGH